MKSNDIYVLSTRDLYDRINAICTVGNDLLSLEEILTISLRNTLDLFKARRGSIFLIEDNAKELVLKASFGMNTSEQKRMVKRMGEGIVGRVAELQKPLIVEDIAKDSRFKGYKPRRGYSSPSFICAPLMIKDKLIGVINVADKDSDEPFTNKDLELLDFLSNQIAVNYQHAHLNQYLKHTQEETKKLKKQIVLQERLATIGKLAGGIAHEFNNPLDGVMRYTNLAIDHLDEDNAVVKEYLLEVRQGLKRMANIVKSLLACARNSQPAMNAIDINRCVELVLKEFHTHLFKKNITIEKHLQKNIPELTDLGIERVLTNLIGNAIDAVEQQGKITVRTSSELGYLKIVIEDNGKGIPKDNMDKIFEPFFTTKSIDQGCGLGLTIVSEIVKYYKGEIQLESAPDKGTVFIIRLPIESQAP